jgi:hypothetical protein
VDTVAVVGQFHYFRGIYKGYGHSPYLIVGHHAVSHMKHLLILISALISLNCFSQQREPEDAYELSIPRTLEKCFPVLDRTLSDAELQVVRDFPEDSIYYHDEFKSGCDFFHAWKLYNGSRLTKYFNKLGLTGSHKIYETILISYHRHLNNEPINLDEQIAKYQAIQKADHEAYVERIQLDSINGNYIPKNLEDCFQTLNRVLKQEDIESIRKLESRSETIKFHHGLGTWMRNNWGLWGGSRIQKYMLDKDWLNEENDGWMEFEEK